MRYTRQKPRPSVQGFLQVNSTHYIESEGEAFECELRRKGLKGELTPANIAKCFDIPLEYGEKIYRNYLEKKAEQN